MRLHEDIDFTTLTWVKPELDETLRQARFALEAYVEDPGDPSQMRFCATYLHQVHGTLRMVELYGAAMVAEEMENLARAIVDSAPTQRDEAYTVLMRGIVQLPDYLERLQSGLKDIPIVLLPLLNELRAARGERGLSEAVLFSPDLSRPLPDSAAGPASPLPQEQLRQRAETLRNRFQAALLRWLRDDSNAEHIAALTEVCDALVQVTHAEHARRLFWVAAGTLEALRAGAFAASKPLKQALARVEREIKRLADVGDNAFRSDPPLDLTKQLLYFVAHAPTDYGRIRELRDVFGLQAHLPSEAELAHAQGSMTGHNRALLDTVCGAIKEDLLRVKDALDLHMRSPSNPASDLNAQVEVLDRVGDTLGMLGLGVPRRVVQEQRHAIADVASGTRAADESNLLDIAGALLYVEASLDDQVARLGQASAADAEAETSTRLAMPSSEAQRLLDTVIKEAIGNFAQARQCFVAFIETNWDHAQLGDVPRLLAEVAGALSILEVPVAPPLLHALGAFVQRELLDLRRVPDGTQMETLADAIAALEYYLEGVRDHRAGRDSVLDRARLSIEQLGYWPLPTAPAPAARAEPPVVVAPMSMPTPVEEPEAESVEPFAPASTEVTEIAEPETVSASPDVAAAFPSEPTPAEAVAAPVASAPPAAAVAPMGFEGAADDIDDEIREVFLEEFQEEIENLQVLLPAWRANVAALDLLRPIRRVFHTLKGSGRLVGALTLGEFSWRIENMLNRVLDGTRGPSPAVVAMLDAACAVLPQLHAALRDGTAISADLGRIKAVADRLAAGEEAWLDPSAEHPASVAAVASETGVSTEVPVVEAVEPEPAPVAVATEPAFTGERVAVPPIDTVLFEILRAEVAGHLATVDDWLRTAGGRGIAATDPLLRAVHTMNGAFAMTEVPVITEVVGPLEGYIKRLLAHKRIATVRGVGLTAEVVGAVREVMLALETPERGLPNLSELAARMRAERDTLPEPVLPTVPMHLGDDHDPTGLTVAVPLEAPDISGLPVFDAPEPGSEIIAEVAAAGAAAEVAAAEAAASEAAEAAAAEAAAAEAAAAEAAAAETAAAEAAVAEAVAAEAAAAEAAAAEAEAAAAEAAAAEAAAAETAAAEAAAAEAVAAEVAAAEAAAAEAAAAEVAAAETAAAEAAAAEAVAAEPAVAEAVAAETATAEAAAAESATADAAAEAAAAEAVAAEAAAAELAAAEAVAAEAAAAEAAAAEAAAAELAAAEAAAVEAAAADAAAAEAAAAELAAAEAAAAEAAAAEAAAAEAAAAEAAAAELAAAEVAAAEAAAAEIAAAAAAASPESIAPESDVAQAPHAASADEDEPDPDRALDTSDLDVDLLDIFIEESTDLLDHSDALLTRLRDSMSDREPVVGLQRDLHTLKGGARMAGINEMGELGHIMESLLESIAEGRLELDGAGMRLLERGFDRLHGMLSRVSGRHAIAMPLALIARFEQAAGIRRAAPAARTAAAPAPAPAHAPTAAAVIEHTAPVAAPPARAKGAPALAPLSAPLDADTGDADDDVQTRAPQEQVRIRADLLDRLVNYAGEVAIYRARLEQQLGAFRGNLVELDQTTSRLREQLRKLEIETEAQIMARFQREPDSADTTFDPLELDRFSTLQQLTRGLSESAADLMNLQSSLDELTRQHETLLLQQSRVSSDLQEGLMRTRMVPFDSLVPRLRRVLRQAGAETGKAVQLKVDGAQGEMDRSVLERMTAPLEHMLRNAVAHGLETPADRKAAGKGEEGLVRVVVSREGSEVVIAVSDDGRGLDAGAIRNKAIERGLLKPDANVSDSDLYGFILQTGFSTAESVSRLAGRGVGMDVVHSEIRQLGGSLGIRSRKGRGSEFLIRLPFTLAVTQAVFVKIGETSFAVPIASVQGVGRMDRTELELGLARGDASYEYAGEKYPVHDLGLLIGHAPAKAAESLQMPLLLARSGELRAAIAVDQVLGSREIVVKPVGPQVSSIPGIFGATVMGDGSVVVILDVLPLVRRRTAAESDIVEPLAPVAAAVEHRVPLVMVVDDSITMRKVTSRVLERQNYEVLTAKDGVDALEKLVEHLPDIMLLDVEMPRMDGYELATHMRNDPRLRHIPIIMITSRTGEKHRQRAFEIGVNRYLGKPYQEAELLRNVGELLGGGDHE
ncbi:MAG: Hpt domain-containing protein [Xanthomonadaceae bacterium]|nr:Hpt domain-containing protein [Xanthomonadaceae bacterium]